MPYDPQRHHRRSIRLKGYDYTSSGAYFVTLCTQDRVHLFGEVVAGEMQHTPYGRVVDTYWSRIPRHFPHVTLDVWVVMPNHFHGIVVITQQPDVDPKFADPSLPPHGAPPGSLGAIVGNFKSITTRRINRMRHTPGERIWQRNYWERIIRDERAFRNIRLYIENNPARWTADRLHPNAPPNSFNQG